jgi:hypothetical protein
LTLSSSGFDSLCAPSVQFGFKARDHTTHLRGKVGALCVVAGHLDRLLSKRIRNCPLVKADFAKNDCDRVAQAVEGQARADPLLTLQS